MPEPIKPAPSASDTTTVYRYEDANGALVLVDDLAKIPKALREKAKAIELPQKKASELERKYEELTELRQVKREAELRLNKLSSGAREYAPDFLADVHAPSFGMGFGLAVSLVLIVKIVRGAARRVLKVAVVVGLVAVLAGGYFGWVRKNAGLGDDTMTNPQQLIDDAKQAAKLAQERLERQEQQLRELEK